MSSVLDSDGVIPRASFRGIPPEIRVHIYKLLFSRVVLRAWYDLRHKCCRLDVDRSDIAITDTCQQVNDEAVPVLLENLELKVEWFLDIDPLAQIHPGIKKLTLPHLRRLTFTQPSLKQTVSIERFRSLAPCLKVVDLGSTTVSIRLSMAQMYDAAINKVLKWPTRSSHEANVSSFNRHLMTVALYCCVASGDSGLPKTSPWLRPLLADKSRKFSLVGHVCGGLMDELGYILYLEIYLTFDLETFAVMDRRVVPWGEHDRPSGEGLLETVRDARVWAFGAGHTVLEGESAEQAEIEGGKLLADLRD